ncbi:small ribosomal subunit biogenesis GTPase RsgA [Microcoleus sp. FACHB-1515]|uniref:small ribosomal subunit biogenesis GTPase RsgA n=1 Tax=Cyanophyceae TaxID=3028117 RepID=UPI00168A3B3C|nr:small ribosomal subunit biogenesis GTPase RsgA [Microcoleus sp. FACHB-1515]MBD2092597.1 small ribosomal subunit biogenesis GTPase RsgA [Microcoleus sp. FACHB-1515]
MSVEAIDSAALVGTVLAVQANYYWVKLDAPPARQAKTLLCTRRTRLKKIGQQVMVGDRVQIEEPDWADKRAAIAQVFPRQTELDRPPIANADQILLVFALAEPTLEPIQLSRFLVKAESTALTVGVCLSKCDLVSAEVQASWRDRLRCWGYESILISTRTSNGLEPLRERLKQNTTVISGPSGVGKSSLINQLVPTVDQRVSAVSGKLGRGRHTTRHVELFELPDGGLLADTPGFNQPDLDCKPIELAQLFPEARSRLANASCQFSDCLHRDEPNCAVRGDWERYAHYLSFLEEAIDRQAALDRQREAESTLKRKTTELGQAQYEPKLATKKYRRPSRRTEKQTLENLYQDLDTANSDGEE